MFSASLVLSFPVCRIGLAMNHFMTIRLSHATLLIFYTVLYVVTIVTNSSSLLYRCQINKVMNYFGFVWIPWNVHDVQMQHIRKDNLIAHSTLKHMCTCKG